MNSERREAVDTGGSAKQPFEDFYRTHYDAISRYVARRLALSAHDEVVAAAFVVAWRKYDAAPEPSLAWLYRIAGFEVAKERRRASRQPQLAGLNDLELTDRHPVGEVLDMSAALSQLSESDAEVLRLVHWDELSRADIAEILGCSVGTLNVRYHRALGRLASTLQRLAHTSPEFDASNHPPKERP